MSSAEVGDQLTLVAGTHRLQARVSLRSHIPVDRLEIVRNGVVVSSVSLEPGRMQARTVVPLDADASGWYVVRAYAEAPRSPVLDVYPFATTSPIYVTIAGQAVRSAVDARYFLSWIDRVRKQVEAHDGWNTDAERSNVLAMIAKARAEFEGRVNP